MKHDKTVIVGGAGVGRKQSKAMETLYMAAALSSTFSEPQSRPLAQVCKRAKGNKSKYGVKCRHGGSCDGYKKPCKFAIY